MEAELKMDYESYLELEMSVLLSLGLTKASDNLSFVDLL